jgi:hypothetical protein
MVSAYRFVTRPPDVEHGHPFLVYDRSGQLHFELTCFDTAIVSSHALSIITYSQTVKTAKV